MPCHRAAAMAIGVPGAEYRKAFSIRFVSTWSICTTSTGIGGTSSRIRTRKSRPPSVGMSRRATDEMRSSSNTGSTVGVSAPARILDRSIRFATRRFNRSDSSRIVCRSSRRWSAEKGTPSSNRLEALALIEASGVRRSWVTEENRAARMRLASASTRASAASSPSRARSRASESWAANAFRTSSAGPPRRPGRGLDRSIRPTGLPSACSGKEMTSGPSTTPFTTRSRSVPSARRTTTRQPSSS